LELGLQLGKILCAFWEGDGEIRRGADAAKPGGNVVDDGLPSII
jgi:hypothetical protein